MMKRALSIRELVLVGILIILVVYYFVVQGPIKRQTEELTQQKADIQTQIDSITARSLRMSQMQSELDEIYERAGGEPQSLAPYSNNKVLLQELNILLNIADEFNISFGAQSFADSVMRREITVSFTTQSEEAAEYIVETIEQSKNTYLVTGFTSTANNNGNEWSSTMNLVNYEYVSPDQETALNLNNNSTDTQTEQDTSALENLENMMQNAQ